MQGFQRIACGLYAVFAAYLLRDLLRADGVSGIVEHCLQLARHARRLIAVFLNRARNLEAAHAARVVRLIMRVGHDQHRFAGAQALRCCPHPALMNNHPRARKQCRYGAYSATQIEPGSASLGGSRVCPD